MALNPRLHKATEQPFLSSPSAPPIPISHASTLDAMFLERVRRTPQHTAYRYYDREAGWRDLNWGEMATATARWRRALDEEKLAAGERVAMLLRNCPTWAIYDQAALSLGLVTVPLYTDDRPDNAAYILRDAAVKVLLIQDAGRWRRICQALGEQTPVQRVIIFEPSEAAREFAREDPRVMLVDDWLPASAPPLAPRHGDPEMLASIVYTSGTTGRPKGVMLSHRNLCSNVIASTHILACGSNDVFLSFLPLSHVLERTCGYYLPVMVGATVAYARQINLLAEDMRTIRPTVMIVVPRIFERIYQRLDERLGGRWNPKRALFNLTVRCGWRRFEHAQGRADWRPLLLLWPLLQRLVSQPIVTMLGKRLRLVVSGGAALPGDIGRTFIGLGLNISQGYGMTEASPVISYNPSDNNVPASVGLPLRGLEVRIGAEDELLVRGPSIMMGYWNNHAATTQVLSADGWLRTGDQARIDNGHIFITGRLKDIIVLSNGEKIAPGDLEHAIALDPLFEQAVVVGEGYSFMSAVIVLNADLWHGLARELALDPEAPASLVDSTLQRAIIQRMRAALRDFPGYAKVRRAVLTLEPWSVENSLLTPTLKIKRTAVAKRFRQEIEAIYGSE